jgi:biopolymer transport protein ExbB/TolQ
MVAPGISEALIADRDGPVRGDPAVIAYNRYSSKVDRLSTFDTFQEEFLRSCSARRMSRTTADARDAPPSV